MIERIHMSGYRSVRDLELELQPINVLTGPTGAAKHSLCHSRHPDSSRLRASGSGGCLDLRSKEKEDSLIAGLLDHRRHQTLLDRNDFGIARHLETSDPDCRLAAGRGIVVR
jgi:hypothetical protein